MYLHVKRDERLLLFAARDAIIFYAPSISSKNFIIVQMD